MKGYCVRCKDKAGRDMKDVKIEDKKNEKTGNVKSMARGTCVTCGTVMCKFLSKEDADKAKAEAAK